MTTGTTHIDVRPLSPTVAAIEISGDVTSASEAPLMEAYSAANTGGAKTIVLDFSGLDYMNSGGIGLLVTLLVRVQRGIVGHGTYFRRSRSTALAMAW